MPIPATGSPTEAQATARAKAQRLANAFAEVFGQQSKRTPSQKLIVDHLRECAGSDGNFFRFHEGRDGLSVVVSGIHRDGAWSILRIIDRQLKIAGSVKVSKTPANVKKT